MFRKADPNSLKPHPLAHIIPDMSTSEWQDFYADIALRGIKVPLEVLANGIVVDGRHRLRAAIELGMKEVTVVDAPLGDKPEVYMLKAAVLRRHLTDDQRAAMAALWKEDHKEPRGRASPNYGKSALCSADLEDDGHPARAQAIELFNVPRRKVDEASKLLHARPDIFHKVHRGEFTLREARKQPNDRERKHPELRGQYNVGIRRGDFREVLSDIPNHSVDLILTDPPYGRDYLPLWNDLGLFAARVLLTTGALVTYSGQLYLPQVISALSDHLDWWWLCALIHQGNGNLTPLGQPVRKVINQFKPILIFVPRGGGINHIYRDLIPGAGKEKDKHNWQQPVLEAKHILAMFCQPGDLVVDPFAGSGAIGQAAREFGCNFLGAEILAGYHAEV